MSMVRLVVRDGKRDLHGDCHGGFAAAVIGALSDDPETIEELECSLDRFTAPEKGGRFQFARPGIDDTPYDAGTVIVDLAARFVACESTYLSAVHRAMLYYHDRTGLTDIAVNYSVSTDWKFCNVTMGWHSIADHRRGERLANPPLDVRVVLYGLPLLEFIARETLAPGQGEAEYDLVKAIHERWLLTPRDDLRGQSPREVLLKDHEHVDRSTDDRQHLWSQTGRRPRGVRPNSAAYRFTGPGTHEIVVYYDMVRALIENCRGNLPSGVSSAERGFVDAECERLRGVREQWLDADYSETGERSARAIIDMERRRLPWGVTGAEAMVDDDCPVCGMMAEDPGPYFWNLDGCNMDQDFAFSFHRTREEWEQEQREWEESSRLFDAEMEQCRKLGVHHEQERASDGGLLHSRMFTVGREVCRILVRSRGLDAAVAGELTRAFHRLREATPVLDVPADEARLQAALDPLGSICADIAASHAEVERDCQTLSDLLARFLDPPTEIQPFDELDVDDLPF